MPSGYPVERAEGSLISPTVGPVKRRDQERKLKPDKGFRMRPKCRSTAC